MMVTIRSSSSEVSSPALYYTVSCYSRHHIQSVYLPLVKIDISLLADQVRVTTSDTLYLGQGVHDLLLPLDIGIEKTQNELKVRFFTTDK
jgi:hypothetical protein